ncbi:MAG TPA: substrate-binding domain-containing protein [Bryobacteraceae bacterium]
MAHIRHQRGIAAVELARQAGVSRQTIYAIEAGSYVPNTLVALKLARALETTVEDLFALPAEAEARPPLRSEVATLLDGAGRLEAGQPVQLCRVHERLIASPPSPVPWYFPAADAVVGDTAAHDRVKTPVEIFQQDEDFRTRILIAGCDPGISVLARHVQAAGVELVLAHRNSTQSLELLKQSHIHVAGTHLRDEVSGESNLPEIQRRFPKNAVAVIAFAMWEEGIVTAAGNPKTIRGIEDFARADVSIVNRELGAGTRVLLDTHLKRLGITSKRVRGYTTTASGHLAAAWQVSSGTADCCIATRAAARVFGLGFVPIVSERYDLAIRRRDLDLPGVQVLLDTLSRSKYRRELEGLGGYDTSATGRRLL